MEKNPHTKGNYLVPVMSVLLALSTISVVLRIFSRAFILRKLGVDDFLIIPGYLAAVTLTVAELISLKYNWGMHVWDVSLDNALMIALCAYIVQVATAVSVMFSKLSILVSYLRFATPRLRIAVWITIAFVTLWCLGIMLTAILSCIPVHLYWDTYVRTPEMKCLSASSQRFLEYLQGGLNIVSDFIVLLLPLPTIWRFNLPVRQKMSVTIILALWSM